MNDESTIYYTPDNMFSYKITNTSTETSYMTNYYVNSFHDAFNKWGSVISTPQAYINSGSSYSIYIDVKFEDLATGILGSASPNSYEYFGNSASFGSTFTKTGTFRINTDYLVSMRNNIFSNGKNELYYTILHEIGHILGIGPYWTFNSISNRPMTSYVENSQTKYYYTGVNALEAYKGYFPDISNNFVGIPIEDNGGAGTANVHPEEDDARDTSSSDRYINGKLHPGLYHELMTGWLNPIPAPMSKVTLGFLEDIGYNVDYSKAEYYDPDNPQS